MAAVEKFLFGRDFETEADGPVGRGAEPAPAPEPEPEPDPEPTYAQADLDAAVEEARAAAHADGLAEGRRQAEQEVNAAQAQALDRLADALGELAAGQTEREEQRDREQLQLAVQLLQRLFPALTRRHGQTEIEAVIQDSLDRLRDEPRVVVRVADGRLDALKDRVDALSAKAGFEGRVVLLADEEGADGDVRVEWADGGAERDSARLWSEIEKAVQRALGPRPVPAAKPAPNPAEAQPSESDTTDAPEPQPTDDAEDGAEGDATADAAPAARRSA